MDTKAIPLEQVAATERAEASAWRDLFAAAPADFAESAGLATTEIGGALALRWVATGRRYFSRTIGLGVTRPAREADVDAALDWFAAHGITMFLLQSLPGCRPDAYEDWLRDRGLEPFDAQDRIICDVRPMSFLAGASERQIRVEHVTPETADEWAEFIQRVYRLDTGTWLQQLVGRPRWHHYVAREAGELVGARSMYVCPDGHGWLGIDGPVPGVMTDDYEPDAAICAQIVTDAPIAGVRRLLADIEAPSDAMDTPSYASFAALGFTRPYVRTHWTRMS